MPRNFNHFLNPLFSSIYLYLLSIIFDKIKALRWCSHPKPSHIQRMTFQLQLAEVCFEITEYIWCVIYRNNDSRLQNAHVKYSELSSESVWPIFSLKQRPATVHKAFFNPLTNGASGLSTTILQFLCKEFSGPLHFPIYLIDPYTSDTSHHPVCLTPPVLHPIPLFGSVAELPLPYCSLDSI